MKGLIRKLFRGSARSKDSIPKDVSVERQTQPRQNEGSSPAVDENEEEPEELSVEPQPDQVESQSVKSDEPYVLYKEVSIPLRYWIYTDINIREDVSES